MKIRIISKNHDKVYNNIDLTEYKNSNEMFWIDIVGESSLLHHLLTDIGVHQLTIEDCTEHENRGKLEKFEEYIFIRMVMLNSAPMHIICFKNLVVTYHYGEDHDEQIIEYCIGRLTRKYRNPVPSSGWVAYAILDRIIDNLIPKINDVNKEIEICKTGDPNFNDLIDKINSTRNDIFWYISHLAPKFSITKSLLSNETRKGFLEIGKPYWVDLNENVTRMKETLHFNNKVLESIQNTFVSKISINIAEQNNVLSKVSEKLTVLTVVFLPMSFITGLFGMNVKVPFQYKGEDGSSDNFNGFIIIMISMLVCSLMSYLYVRIFAKN